VITRLFKQWDTGIASIGIIAMLAAFLFLSISGYPTVYLVAVGIGLVGLVFYLLTIKQLSKEEINCNSNISTLFTILALGALAIAVLFFSFRPDPYVKPLSYYVFSSFAVGLAFLGMLLVESRKQVYTLLGFACVVGLLHIWTESLMFPNSLIGIDPWAHMGVTTQVLDLAGTGQMSYIVNGETRDYFPALTWTSIGGGYSLMHIYLRAIINTFDLSYRMAALVFMGSLQTVANIVLVYLIGQKIFSLRVGLVAALMLSIAGWAIYSGEWIIPNSIGATYSLLAAYMLIILRDEKKYWLIAPILLVLGMSYYTHFIAALWVTGTLASLILLPFAFDITKRVKQRIKNTALTIPIIVALFAITGLWLTFTDMGGAMRYSASSYDLDISVNPDQGVGAAALAPYDYRSPETHLQVEIPGAIDPDIVAPGATIRDVVTPDVDAVGGKIPIIINEHMNNGAVSELILSSMGMLLSIGIALLGIRLMIRERRFRFSRTWAVICLGTLMICVVPTLLGITMLRERWFYFAEVLLAIPLAVVLVKLPLIGKRKLALIVVAVLVSITAFFSTIGLPANMTNRTLSPNLIVRYAFTDKELEGWKVAQDLELWRAKTEDGYRYIGADPIYLCSIGVDRLLQLTGALAPIDPFILSGDFSGCPADVLLLRDALYKEPFGYGSGAIYELGFNPADVATQQGYKEIWRNEEIRLLVRE